jgi:hypothetical protein
VVDKLNREINTAFVDTKIKARFSELGSVVLPGSASRKCRPAQFRKPRLHFGVGDTATPAFDRGRSCAAAVFDRALAAGLAIATSRLRDNATGAPVWTGCGRCRKMTWCKQRLLREEKES